jgi:hypothetical protein
MSTVTGGQGNIVTNGLVLNLDAANPRSYPQPYNGTVWADLSGNGNTGVLTNGAAYNATNGGSIVFDGTNDSVNLSQSNTIDVNSLTWSGWFNGIYSAQRAFLFIGNAVGQAISPYKIFIGTIVQSGQNRLRINYNNVATVNLSNLVDNNTYNLSITYNGTTTIMYVNGVAIGSSTAMSGNLNSKTYAYIGSTAQSSEFFSGKIYNTYLYNRALSSSEVLQNFNATRARFGI